MDDLKELEEMMLEATSLVSLKVPVSIWAMWKKLPRKTKREVKASFIKMVREAYRQAYGGR